MAEAESKFEQTDLPLILAAIHKAKHSGMNAEVTIKFKFDGGCVEVHTHYTQKIK
jgi:hypothetical protein